MKFLKIFEKSQNSIRILHKSQYLKYRLLWRILIEFSKNLKNISEKKFSNFWTKIFSMNFFSSQFFLFPRNFVPGFRKTHSEHSKIKFSMRKMKAKKCLPKIRGIYWYSLPVFFYLPKWVVITTQMDPPARAWVVKVPGRRFLGRKKLICLGEGFWVQILLEWIDWVDDFETENIKIYRSKYQNPKFSRCARSQQRVGYNVL